MRHVVRIIPIFLAISLTFNCRDKNVNFEKDKIFNSLSGYWIPKEIRWGGDSKDTGDLFRIASFYTLCFDSAGKFTMFASTQRQPKNYNDSIIFAGEPIVKVFKGSWKPVDTSFVVSYKLFPEGSTPVDSVEKHEAVQEICYSNDTLLLFRNVLYERTKKYDKISRESLDAYKKVIEIGKKRSCLKKNC